MEFPCRNCITLAMCKGRFDRELKKFSKRFYDKNMGDYLKIWYAFNTMTRVINCDSVRSYMVYKFDSSHDEEIRAMIQKFIVTEIKITFKVE